VAGRRAGLSGERSGLFFEAVRLIREMREATDGECPAFAVFENVPGLLSSHGGRDFAVVLGTLVECGALDIAWRILDARHFGVAQRRRRVFLVADFRAERAAAVLFEPESGSGHPAPGKEAGPRVAASLVGGAGSPRSRGKVNGENADVNLVYQCHGNNVGPLGTLRQGDGGLTSGVPFVAHAPRAHGHGRYDPNGEDYVVAHALDTQHGATEDGTGRGVPLVIEPLYYSHDYNQDRVYASAGIAPALTSQDSSRTRNFQQGPVVRRLTPVECERLMGLPDGHTAGESDSTRYRMLGNSCVVNVVQWLGERLLAER
jgi:DNA (cytosine-5)-methyltransferase 1